MRVVKSDPVLNTHKVSDTFSKKILRPATAAKVLAIAPDMSGFLSPFDNEGRRRLRSAGEIKELILV
jgi:hypothetical protein